MRWKQAAVADTRRHHIQGIQPPRASQAAATAIDATVIGTPALAKSPNLRLTPVGLALSATIRLARLPTSRRFPANVLNNAKP